MKSTLNKPAVAFIASTAAFLAAVPATSADILLTIDIAHATTTGMVITATDGLSAITNSDFTQFDGISLADFWSVGNMGLWGIDWNVEASSADLGVADSGILWSVAATGTVILGAAFDNPSMADFNFYRTGDNTAMSFVTGSLALSGSMTLPADQGTIQGDFTWSRLRPAGTVGNIYLGWGDNMGPLIGEYQVINSAIPEPSSFAAIAGLGVLGVAALRRRRRF